MSATDSGAQTSQHGTLGLGVAGSPKCLQDRRAATPVAFDERPDRAVLAPARADAVRRRRAAGRASATVVGRLDPPAHPVHRRRRGAQDPGAHEMTDDRADLLGVGAERPRVRVDAPVRRRREQPLGDAVDLLARELGALDEEHVQALVLGLREQQRPRRKAVAARAARLLVPGLERRRDADVGDRPHVRLVDAHAERVRRDDHVEVAVHEPPLDRRAPLAGEARVVGGDLDAERGAEVRRDVLALRAGAGVDDRGTRGGVGECPGQARRDVGGCAARNHGERQVRPVEAGRDADRLAQAQAPLDVGGDLRRRRGRRGDDRLCAEPARGVRQAEVVGPEVVPPLRDAVRLVDDEEADRHLAQRLEEAGRGEALRRDVEQPQLARPRAVQHPAVGVRVLLGVDERDRAADAALERLDLVLHQRDERRDDDRQVAAQQRRKLVAERLPGAGRHHDQDVAPREGAGHRLRLTGAEVVEAEDLAQRAAGFLHRGRPP